MDEEVGTLAQEAEEVEEEEALVRCRIAGVRRWQWERVVEKGGTSREPPSERVPMVSSSKQLIAR